MPQTATFRVWRGDAQGGEFRSYPSHVSEGMVVLDAVHQIQAQQAHDLPSAGTARLGNAVHAPRKSTATRGSCA